ncbi:MAG: hypothetical protein R3212_10905 [Xanthomonadales bacterium]|nr:hypothetical protein [Xanthomonadales bacterium]
MKRLLAALLLCALGSPAAADCLPFPEGGIELRGVVTSCQVVRAPPPADESLLQLHMDSPSALILDCGERECLPPSLHAPYLDLLEGRDLFFLRAGEGISCSTVQVEQPLVARVMNQCCDTVPHRGFCAVDGPVLEPGPDGR